jgi:hypothetical protein
MSGSAERASSTQQQRNLPRWRDKEYADGFVGHAYHVSCALEHIRLRYRHLFTSRRDTMVQFLWQDDLLSVARFIADCFDHFQSGGDPS